MRAKFSERMYEFEFNSEFKKTFQKNAIVIPYLPSQNEEGSLGYDVSFDIIRNRHIASFFFQHKVPIFIKRKNKNNSHIYSHYFSPFFYYNLARLDSSQQHNLLVNLSNQGENVFYSSAIFYLLNDLYNYSISNEIINNSILLNPSQIGEIKDFLLHKISYNSNGSMAFFDSPKSIKLNPLTFSEIISSVEYQEINTEYLINLFNKLKLTMGKTYQAKYEEFLAEKNFKNEFDMCVYLIRHYYNLNWIMIEG